MSDHNDESELGFLFPETEEELMHFDIHNKGKDGLAEAEIEAVASRVLARLGENPGVAINLACTYCKGGLARGGSVYCAGCLAPHHPDCFHEYSGCSSCGEGRFVLPKNLGQPRPSPARSRARPWAFLGGLAIGGLSVALAFTQWTGSEPGEPLTATENPPIEEAKSPPKTPQGETPPPEAPKPEAPPVIPSEAEDDLLLKLFEDHTTLIEIAPSAELYLGRAEVGVMLKRFRAAIADLKASLELDPGQAKAYLLSARAHLALGDLEAALVNAQKALELSPDKAKAYTQRAAIYQSLGRYERSLFDLTRANELDPRDPGRLRELARALRMLGRYPEALERLDRSLAFDPSSAETYYLRAEVYALLRQSQRAAMDLSSAYRLDPDRERFEAAARVIEEIHEQQRLEEKR